MHFSNGITFSRNCFWYSFEGINGAGKTTLINHLITNLGTSIASLETLLLPKTSLQIGKFISTNMKDQNFFLTFNTDYPFPFSESLFLASDYSLVIEKAICDLNNKIIISDRGPDSRIAIHTAAIKKYYPSIDENNIIDWLIQVLKPFPKPNRTFLLRAPLGVIQTRLAIRNNENHASNNMTGEHIQFLDDVDRLFLKLYERDKGRFCVLNAELPLNELSTQVVKVIIEDLRTHGAN